MLVRARIDQLRGNAYRIAGLAHTAFEDMADAQLLRDGAGTQIGFAKLKRGGARGYFEPVDVSEYVEYFLRDAVCEIALVALRREIRKGKDRNGCDRWRWLHGG